MATSAKDFFAGLSLDPERLSQFVASPEKILGESGLTDEVQKAILEKDVATLSADIGLSLSFSNFDYHWCETVRRPASLDIGNMAGLSLSEVVAEEEERPQRRGPTAKKGVLYVVGTGIRVVGQLTAESSARIKAADRVFYVLNDPVAEASVRMLNPMRSESLSGYYAQGKSRLEAYRKMVDRVLESVRSGESTCLVTYGHPGAFALPSHASLRLARQEGFEAHMLPAISAEDCLFADLWVDPAAAGCASYEATDFLLRTRVVDRTAALILWQIGVTGNPLYHAQPRTPPIGLTLLVDKLVNTHKYPRDHKCVLYEASLLPDIAPLMAQVELQNLPTAPALTANCTLYIPPISQAEFDRELVDRLKANAGPAATGPGVAPKAPKPATHPKGRAKGQARKAKRNR
jgi:hypothetical protein